MELFETIDDMASIDYRKRFKAEYNQLTIRANKLAVTIALAHAGKLNFELVSPVELLEDQLEAMDDYIDILTQRAELEGIELD